MKIPASIHALFVRATSASLLIAAMVPLSFAQTAERKTAPATPMAASAPTSVPALVPYSGVAVGNDGKPLSGEVSMTFVIYKNELGGEPLFVETQTVAVDPVGRYTAQLGATLSSGIPIDLFATGEARWLEVQVAGAPAQPRVLLAASPTR
jgi:trimeric autotransporter adhesin